MTQDITAVQYDQIVQQNKDLQTAALAGLRVLKEIRKELKELDVSNPIISSVQKKITEVIGDGE